MRPTDDETAPLHILYCCDSAYLSLTTVAAASLLAFASRKTLRRGIHLHLFGLRLTEEELDGFRHRLHRIVTPPLCTISHVAVTDADFTGFPKWKGGYVNYLRLLAPRLLPELDWVLYLDGDTLFLDDVGELWGLRDDALWLMGYKDPCYELLDWPSVKDPDAFNRSYLCAGTILMNLAAMRTHRMQEAVPEFFARNPNARYADQSFLNAFCAGHSEPWPSWWGEMPMPGCRHYDRTTPKLLHLIRLSTLLTGKDTMGTAAFVLSDEWRIWSSAVRMLVPELKAMAGFGLTPKAYRKARRAARRLARMSERKWLRKRAGFTEHDRIHAYHAERKSQLPLTRLWFRLLRGRLRGQWLGFLANNDCKSR